MALEPITMAEQIMSGESLEPITREEMFLAKAAGMDVDTPEPITRREMFLSMIQPGGGSGLPSGAKPNQYLVTDGEGNAKWEDKLCWNGKEVVIEEQTFTTTDQEMFLATVEGVDYKFEVGEECVVTWDGVEHKCVCKTDTNYEDGNVLYLGNPEAYDGVPGEPFHITLYYIPVGNGFTNVEIVAKDGISHTVGIATETIHPIDKKYLPSGNTIFFVQSATQGQGDAFLYRTEEGANNYDYAQRVSKSELEAAFFAGAISVNDISLGWYFMPSYVRFDRQWGEMMINDAFVCRTAEYVEEEG